MLLSIGPMTVSKIKIETQKTDKGIVLTFADNGIGFDADRHKIEGLWLI